MHKLSLVSVLVFILGSLQALILDVPVHAKHVLWHCCSCGMCDSTCYCKYQTPYCFCTVPDEEGIHPDHHTDTVTVNMRRMREPRAFNVAQSNITERLKTLMAGERIRSTFALKLLDHFENDLKMWCPGSAEKVSLDNTVAVQTR